VSAASPQYGPGIRGRVPDVLASTAFSLTKMACCSELYSSELIG